MQSKKKIGNTIIRVMEVLKLLTSQSASIQDIIHHFEKIDPNNRTYTNEVILKYINTLKVAGYRFIKQKDKYILMNSPYQIDFNKNELNAINIITMYAQDFPEKKIKIEIEKLIQELEKKFSDNTRILCHKIEKPITLNAELKNTKYTKEIKSCEKYCEDGQRLKISYKKTNSDENTTTVMVEPIEIKYNKNEVYLSLYNPLSARVQDINFKNIINIEQLPSKSNTISMYSSVTFELQEPVAKRYKLREWERVIQHNQNGSIIVLNKQEDTNILLKRLIRYAEHCTILTPKHFREEMKQLIQASLMQYN